MRHLFREGVLRGGRRMRGCATALLLACFLCGCATSPKLLQLRPAVLAPLEESPAKIPYIHKGSPAEKAGLRVGDVIVRVSEQQVNSLSDAEKLINAIKGEGTIQIRREDRPLDLKLNVQDSAVPSGILFFPERYALRFPDGRYTDTQLKNGLAVGIVGAATTERGSVVSFVLWVMNHSDEAVAVAPQDILVLDGNNSILKMYSTHDLAAAVSGTAQSKFDTYAYLSSAQVAAAASQPPTYNISGSSNTYGSGNVYSYGNYGYYNYSGSTASSYQATPQPNYSATGAMLGQAIGLMIARKRLEREQQSAQALHANAFEFGEVPQSTNRRGLLLCDAPMTYPLQIKVTINGNEYAFALEKEIQEIH